MKEVNLLEFLNKIKTIRVPDYADNLGCMVNYLDLLALDDDFVQKVNFGVFYISQQSLDRVVLADGSARIISLSLLLHAICECYKKTTPKNAQAIEIIRKKYLLNGVKSKLQLPEEMKTIYEKIIYGDRLSAKEKKNLIFQRLHSFWTQIKEEELQASEIFKMLQKASVFVDDINPNDVRELYYVLNKHRKLNGINLVKDYLAQYGLKEAWSEFAEQYNNKESDIIRFFNDFFKNKFNFKDFSVDKLYEYFVNYFETIIKYTNPKSAMERLQKSASLYLDLLNVNMGVDELNKLLVKIKMYEGEDTYPYLLSVYEDYKDGNLTESTLTEIMTTVAEYLKNRQKTGNDLDFNELINYLNAFLACK